jgi:vancomycin permeability regulator SanA
MNDNQKKVDIILVLGGGISKEGQLPEWVLARLDLAYELFQAGIASKILLSGKGRDNFPIAEADAMSKYLVKCGMSPQDFLLECQSKDTLQNAYFSRVIHIDPLKIKSALIITNQFHFERTELIFTELLGRTCSLIFKAVNDQGLMVRDLELRAFTERKLMSFYQRLFQSIPNGDLNGLHDVIFNQNNVFYREYEELGTILKDKMVLY